MDRNSRHTTRVLFSTLRFLAAGMIALCGFGCADPNEVKVQTTYGPGVKLRGIGDSYVWSGGPPVGRMTEKTPGGSATDFVRNRVNRTLAPKGFTLTDVHRADFLLKSILTRGISTDRTSAHGTTYKSGTLVLEVLDPNTRKLIWRGIAYARLNDADPPEVRRERMKNAIAKLMETFPPRD